MKILVVDDDETNRKLLSSFLKKVGECETAVDGVDAVEKYKAAKKAGTPYHLVCLDIMMPNMNGQDVLHIIRDIEDSSEIPYSQRTKIIMTTALNDADNVMTAFGQQCDGYIVKPIKRDKLMETLEDAGVF